MITLTIIVEIPDGFRRTGSDTFGRRVTESRFPPGKAVRGHGDVPGQPGGGESGFGGVSAARFRTVRPRSRVATRSAGRAAEPPRRRGLRGRRAAWPRE